ncbi:uncharacterized protein LOC124898659 [Capsicum annuum]|uniref:uncharacterized protein LOC124898659 n=1 Tax=Capsicum annuum TaxID=4072 RepID=UPI001FB1327F|nr:uncharacterized protein LOC124898659 [Capsicum annuum]
MDAMFNDDGKSKLESLVKKEVASKLESPIEEEAFISIKVFDAFHDEGCIDLHPDKTNVEINSQYLIPDELLRNEMLSSLNAYQRKSITTHPSAIRAEETTDENLNDKMSEFVVEDDFQKTYKENAGLSSNQSCMERIRRPSKFKESPYTSNFGLTAGSSGGKIRIFSQKHPYVYHPIDGIVDTKIVKKFMDWISVDLLKVHAKRKGKVDHYKKGKSAIEMMQFGVETIEDKNWFYTMGLSNQSWTGSRKKSKYEPNSSYKYNTLDCNFMNIISSVMDIYSVDDPNLNAGGQEAHLHKYINGFRMYIAVPGHTVEDIYIPVNRKEKHYWVLTVFSFSKRCIFLYDSYESSGHYAAVLAEIKKLADIISLCLQACNFYEKKSINLQKHPRYKDKDPSDLFDVIFEDNLP